MVSRTNLLLLGAAAVAIGIGGFGLSKTKKGGEIIQNVFGAKDPIPEVQAPIINPNQSFIDDISKSISSLTRDLFPRVEPRAPRGSQKKVFFAPPKRLTDSQILGQRRLIAKSQARGIGRLTQITFNRANQLTTFEQARRDQQLGAIRSEKINLLEQLKVLKSDVISL